MHAVVTLPPPLLKVYKTSKTVSTVYQSLLALSTTRRFKLYYQLMYITHTTGSYRVIIIMLKGAYIAYRQAEAFRSYLNTQMLLPHTLNPKLLEFPSINNKLIILAQV